MQIKCGRDGNKYIFTEKQFEKFKEMVCAESTRSAAEMAILIILCWLKDEEYVANDPEALVAEYRHFETWFNAIDEHLLELRDMKKMIEDATGMKLCFTNGETRCVKDVK